MVTLFIFKLLIYGRERFEARRKNAMRVRHVKKWTERRQDLCISSSNQKFLNDIMELIKGIIMDWVISSV